jgi:hypothetical protein
VISALRERVARSLRATPALNGRIAVAGVIGVLSALYVTGVYVVHPRSAPDFDQWWIAANALRLGHDPYAAVGASGWPWPLFYPLPAVLCVLPFSFLSVMLGRALFVGLGGACLAFAVTQRAWWPLVLFTSGAWVATITAAQWTPFLVAGALIPAFGALFAAKPTIGAVSFVYRPSLAAVIGSLALVGLSFAVRPSWFGSWMDAVSHAPNLRAPITRPGGFLLLLALLRWRRPEARLLGTLACVPHTILPQEALVLFLVPRTYGEGAALSLLTSAALVFTWLWPTTGYREMLDAAWPVMLLLVYLPVLVMVLRRPNLAPQGAAEGG